MVTFASYALRIRTPSHRRFLLGLVLGGTLVAGILASLEAVATEGFPRTVTQANGRAVVIPHRPHRIVSATLVSDHILLALVGPERILAITGYAADPAYSFMTDVARKFQPSRRLWQSEGISERLLTWQPDLVVLGSFSDSATVANLRDAGIPVLVLHRLHSLEGVRANIRTLGVAVGEEEAAGRLIEDMSHRLETVARRVSERPRVRVASYFVLSGRGLTHGAETSFDAAIGVAGGENVAVSSAGLRGSVDISMERLLDLDPEVMLVPGDDGKESLDRRHLLSRPGARGLSAVRAGRIMALPPRYFHPVSHHIAESVERFARLLHPEAFAKEEGR